MSGEQLYSNIMLAGRSGAVSAGRARAAAAAVAHPPPARPLLSVLLPGPACAAMPLPSDNITPPACCCCLQSAGSMKAAPTGLVWKRSGGGRTVEVAADGAPAASCAASCPCPIWQQQWPQCTWRLQAAAEAVVLRAGALDAPPPPKLPPPTDANRHRSLACSLSACAALLTKLQTSRA